MARQITYLTSPPLLDNAIEQVSSLSNSIDINLVLLVSNKSNSATIFQLKKNVKKPGIYKLNELKEDLLYYDEYDNYLSKCKSVYIVLFSNYFFLNAIQYYKLFKLNVFRARVLHFDDISGIGLIVLLRYYYKKIFLNIHDPIPHSGEYSCLNTIIKKSAMFFSDYFIVYSEFAKNQFVKEYGNKKNLVQLSLVPYLFYSKLNPNKIELKKNSQLITFLFFGRVSKYKGIPELIDSFLKLSALNPNLRLIIAGKGKIDATEIHNEKIEIRNYFIVVSEMYELFQITDVIVCPYRDATQSGVVMTANAFNIPTIVSNVGALPENTYYKELVYDTENENGLENTMLKFINSVESYGIKKSNRSNLNESNSSTLITLYDRE